MNLFLEYQEKIFKSLKALEKKELLVIPSGIKNITVELPPKGLKGDLSCNAALVLAKENKKSPFDIANFLMTDTALLTKPITVDNIHEGIHNNWHQQPDTLRRIL